MTLYLSLFLSLTVFIAHCFMTYESSGERMGKWSHLVALSLGEVLGEHGLKHLLVWSGKARMVDVEDLE